MRKQLPITELPDTLTVREVAGVLRLSVNNTYEAIRRGQIPSFRIGRRVLVPKAAVLQLLGRQDSIPATEAQVEVTRPNSGRRPQYVDDAAAALTEFRIAVSGEVIIRVQSSSRRQFPVPPARVSTADAR